MQLNEKLSDHDPSFIRSGEVETYRGTAGSLYDHRGSPHLDGEYTVFGEVIEGMEIVDSIAEQETDDNCRPLRDVVILKIEEE